MTTRYLIGPETFGGFLTTLRVAMSGVLVGACAAGVVRALSTGDSFAGLTLGASVAINGLLVAIGVVTLLFAGLEASPKGRASARRIEARMSLLRRSLGRMIL